MYCPFSSLEEEIKKNKHYCIDWEEFDRVAEPGGDYLKPDPSIGTPRFGSDLIFFQVLYCQNC